MLQFFTRALPISFDTGRRNHDVRDQYKTPESEISAGSVAGKPDAGVGT
jgi:hypothetical protein